MKNRFQNLPFKCNLQRYTVAAMSRRYGSRLVTTSALANGGVNVNQPPEPEAAEYSYYADAERQMLEALLLARVDTLLKPASLAGLYKSNAVDPHSLKGAWFQPLHLKRDILVSKFAFDFNLYRYALLAELAVYFSKWWGSPVDDTQYGPRNQSPTPGSKRSPGRANGQKHQLMSASMVHVTNPYAAEACRAHARDAAPVWIRPEAQVSVGLGVRV
jgi:hypothetical protein